MREAKTKKAKARAESPGKNDVELAAHLDATLNAVLDELREPLGRALTVLATSVVQAMTDDEARKAERESKEEGDIEVTRDLAASKLIKNQLSQAGISQSELARRMGVKPPVVNRILRHPHRAKLSTWERMGAAIGIPLVQLLPWLGQEGSEELAQK